MSFKTTLFIAAALGTGAGFGWLMRDMNVDAPAAFESGPFATPATITSARNVPAIDLEQVRQVVRAEIQSAQANGGGKASPAPAAEKPATPELIAKRRAAVDEIETMIRSGEWGNEQRATFHQHMSMLDPEQGARLLREVTIAFNQGTMRVTTDGPPL